MRTLLTLALSSLLACGPGASPLATASTSTTLDTTDTTLSAPTTTNPTAPSLDTTALESTTLVPTTAADTFILKPDGNGTGTLACDPFVQDCPPGQKCVPWISGDGDTWNALKCVDITGEGAPGEPCTAPQGGGAGLDDCALGSICWDLDANNLGTCIGQCTGTADAPSCPPQAACAIASDTVAPLCIFDCDPLLQNCPGTDLCIPNGDGFLCVLDASGDEGQLNDPCDLPNACDPGLVCLPTATASAACQQGPQGCCQPFCQLPDTPCPNPDQQCSPLSPPPPPGFEAVGVCRIPE